MSTTILVAADARWVRDQVRGAFVGPDQRVVEVTRGQEVRNAVRLEESGGRLPRATILLLLDRDADKFLGRRADVDAMLVKPVDAGVLRRAARQLLERAS